MTENFEIAKNLLSQNGEITGITSGNSMKPLFRSGKDKAVIIPATTKYKVGDVLLYKPKNSDVLNLHRVVKITKGKPILRGDGLFFAETDIPSKNIVGIMKGFYRNDKYYDCRKSLRYKLYVFYICTSFPLRHCLHKAVSLFKIIKRKL